MRNTLDFLAMAATALAISLCAFDLAVRASDPYDINKPRQRRSPSRGNHTDTVLTMTAPKAQGEGSLTVFAPHASPSIALASPSFPATSMAGQSTQEGQHDVASTPPQSPAIRHFPPKKEVSPAPGRVKRQAVTPNQKMHTGSAASLAGRSGPCEITTYGTEYRPGGRYNRDGKANTSSGARYNYKALTCAVNRVKGRPALPYGTWIKVSYGKNSVICKITDTGGHKPRGAKIWFDLSCASMAELMGKPLDPQRAYNSTFVATFEVVKTPVSVAVTARRKR